MHPQRLPRFQLTADEICASFPDGVFGLGGALAATRVAGHGAGSCPPGVTQITLAAEGVRIETAHDRGPRDAMKVDQLVFERLVEDGMSFPLTLRIERYERRINVDAKPTIFDTFALDSRVLAVAAIAGVTVTVRCPEAMLDELELVRLDRKAIEQIVRQAVS